MYQEMDPVQVTEENRLQLIDEYLKDNLTEKRICHTEGVEKTALVLAQRYGADKEKVRIAARLHDACRKWDEERLNAFLQINDYDMERYMDNVNLAHGKAAMQVAKHAFAIKDEDILNAIAYHTTGRAGMSLLEKIIYIADAVEPGRDYEGVDALREVAIQDLDKACLMSLEGTRDYVLSQHADCDEDTIEAIAWFTQSGT